MQRTTLYSAFFIVILLIILVVGKIVTQNAADEKRSLYQQQIQEPVAGRLDLSKYPHLKQQPKHLSPSEPLVEDSKKGRIQDSDRRILMTAGGSGGSGSSSSRTGYLRESSSSESSSSSSSSLVDKFRQGLDSWFMPTGFGRRSSSTTTTTTTPKPDNRREEEWAPREEYRAGYRSPSSGSQYRSEPEPAPKTPEQPPQYSCANCVKNNYLAHYRERSCQPVYDRSCDCPKYYKCPKNPVKPKLSESDSVKASAQENAPCIYGGKVYSINERIPNPDEPCRMCRCRRRQFFNGTSTRSYGEIDCSLFVECPEMVFGVKPKRPTCHFAYRHDQCCGTEVCTDELPREDVRAKTQCRYRGKVFKWGEQITPEENSCLKCLCDENWNEHDPTNSPSCKARQCSAFLQENVLNKCTPIYRIDGCCPIDFICPEKRKLYDREEQEAAAAAAEEERFDEKFEDSNRSKPEAITESKTAPNKCILDGRSYLLGSKLYMDRRNTQHGRTCARCECKVPPQLTCQADFRCTGVA